jgi:hypothetical protein
MEFAFLTKNPNEPQVRIHPSNHVCDKPVFEQSTPVVIVARDMTQIRITDRSLLLARMLGKLRM